MKKIYIALLGISSIVLFVISLVLVLNKKNHKQSSSIQNKTEPVNRDIKEENMDRFSNADVCSSKSLCDKKDEGIQYKINQPHVNYGPFEIQETNPCLEFVQPI